MKRVFIDLPVSLGSGRDHRWEIVVAEFVDIAPHITVGTFAVHKTGNWFSTWRVSNIETGLYIADGHDRKHALSCAASCLADKTDADILCAYKKAQRACRVATYKGKKT